MDVNEIIAAFRALTPEGQAEVRLAIKRPRGRPRADGPTDYFLVKREIKLYFVGLLERGVSPDEALRVTAKTYVAEGVTPTKVKDICHGNDRQLKGAIK